MFTDTDCKTGARECTSLERWPVNPWIQFNTSLLCCKNVRKLFCVFDVSVIVSILGWTEQKEQPSGSGEARPLNPYTVSDQEKQEKQQQKTQQSQIQQLQTQVYIGNLNGS